MRNVPWVVVIWGLAVTGCAENGTRPGPVITDLGDKWAYTYVRRGIEGSDLTCFEPKTLAKNFTAAGTLKVKGIVEAGGDVRSKFDQILRLTPDQQDAQIAIALICKAFAEKAISETDYKSLTRAQLGPPKASVSDWNSPEWQIARNHIDWVLQANEARAEYKSALGMGQSKFEALKFAQSRVGNGGKGSPDGVYWITQYGEPRVNEFLSSRGE